MTKEERGWPTYLFGGRVRTSTVALIVAFLLVWWLYQEYKPAPEPPAQAPASNVVPPGFVPDPNYTWVPRTDVQEPRRTTTTTTPTTTETTTPTETTSPTESTTSGSPTTSPTTTTPPPPGAPPPSPTTAVPGPGPSPTPSR